MVGRMAVAGLLVGLAGAGAVAAGERHGYGWGPHGGGGHGRWSAFSPEDRAAFTDARIAALHAGLKLTTDQERLWPAVETALRDLAKQRETRREASRDLDPPAALRGMADAATARGEALRRLADATGPLYATLDDSQKRRAAVLSRPMRPGFGRHGGPGGMRERGPEAPPETR